MKILMIFLIVYLMYGCLLAITAENSKSEVIKDHPNLSIFVITFMWGLIFTILLFVEATSIILGVKKNETNRVSEPEKQDKES